MANASRPACVFALVTRKILALFLLLGIPLPARAAERLLTPPAFEPMMAYYSTPALATDGSSFLAAWVATPYDRTPMLMVQRLGAPAPPRALVTDPQLQNGTAGLVWSGSNYLLVWSRIFELHATRLDRDGRLLGDRVIATDLRDPVVAAGSAATLVVAHSPIGDEIAALTLDAHDNVVKRRSIWSYAFAPCDAVARDGGFTVAIADPRGIFAMRFDAAGDTFDATPQLMTSSAHGYTPSSLALASRGADTLLVWSMTLFRGPSDFFAALLPPFGDLGAPATLPHPDTNVGAIDTISDGDGYSVVFASGTQLADGTFVRHLQAFRLAADGTSASAPSRVTSDDASSEWLCRLARNGNGYAMVAIASSGDSVTTERITAVTTPRLGDASAPVDLSRAATSQSGPSIASNGSGYLVAWLERSLTRDQILVMPLDRDGPPTALFDSHFSYTSEPKVVFGGGLYLVTWEVDGAAWGVRLDAAGRALDAAPVQLSGSVGADAPQFDVTATPGGFFIVWIRAGSIYGASLTGQLPAPPQKLTQHMPARPTDAAFESDPHVAFNGETFLLTYASTSVAICGFPGCAEKTTWQMMGLDSTAAPRALDSAVLGIASDGHDFAVAQAGRVLRIDAKTFSPTARIDLGGLPRIVWNGSHYFAVAFDGATRATAFEIAPDWTLGGVARVASVAPKVNAVAAAANAAGVVVIAYARFIAAEPFQGAPRAAVQTVDELAPPRGRASRRP